MSLALALWLILVLVAVAYLAGHGHGRGRGHGRHETARLVEAKYGPLLEQLEQLAEQTDALAAHLSGEARSQINERIEAMRKASRLN